MGEDDVASSGQWNGAIQQIGAALAASSGFDRLKLQAQLDDAEKGRQNALALEKMRGEVSKYGIDAQRATAMAQLKENARQFDLNHGLDVAKAYTQFASTPDMMFARNDFLSAMGNVGQGLSPTGVMDSGATPHMNTWADFQALQNGQLPSGSGGSGSGGGGAAPAASGAPSGGGGGGGTDPRVTAATAVMKAIPPSDGSGHDDQDYAALNAIRSLYSAGSPDIQRLGRERTKTAMAGLARLGYDPVQVQEDYTRTLPGQGANRAY